MQVTFCIIVIIIIIICSSSTTTKLAYIRSSKRNEAVICLSFTKEAAFPLTCHTRYCYEHLLRRKGAVLAIAHVIVCGGAFLITKNTFARFRAKGYTDIIARTWHALHCCDFCSLN